MKENSKPSSKVALVDLKPISIPVISSSTTTASGGGSIGGSPSSSTGSPPSQILVAAVAEAVALAKAQAVVEGASLSPAGSPLSPPPPTQVEVTIGIKSLARSGGGSNNRITFQKPGMVSKSTQTGTNNNDEEVQPAPVGGGGGAGEDLQEKRRLIRKQLAVLLHAVLCRVRDELIGNTGDNARACPTAYCGLMKNVLNHLRTCDARQDCPHPHCLSSRQILSHWKACVQADCPVCSSLRRVVPAYLDAVVSNPRWRGEIMTRFNWLITFIGPISMRVPQNQSVFHRELTPQQQQERQRELDEMEERSHTKMAEE